MRKGRKKITHALPRQRIWTRIEMHSMEQSLSTKQIVLYLSICFAAHCPSGHVLSAPPSLSV